MSFKNRLLQIKDVTEEDADKILGIIRNEINPEEVSKKATKYVRSCYRRPEAYLIKLYAIDEIIHTCGVECEEGIDYCNSGETYALTVMYVNGSWKVSCLGDEAE
ncbi:MAG: hypothetical protein M0R17_00790 [Candidatus Omnitrophica bacterium]|jgi:hypothetical protein|nr:hypothetical protein [Candidatus Omnitrophota bacterium]